MKSQGNNSRQDSNGFHEMNPGRGRTVREVVLPSLWYVTKEKINSRKPFSAVQ